jgi:aryl-alcohol dehydrogenase-like predicted oxidoreductase
MYSVPPRRETFGATERILGSWFAHRPGMRNRVVLASKVAGPARGMDWVRGGSADVREQDIVDACDASLARLGTDRIDIYQIHWPNRNAPSFGALYFDPSRDRPQSSIHEQLGALGRLVRAGKVRHVGLSNETPYGVSEFVRVADNGLDEMMCRHNVSLLAYSPLAFGALTGKYDDSGFDGEGAPRGRMALFDSMRKQRWGRAESLAAAREYNALARDHGFTPTRMALAFCFRNWRVASTLVGVSSREQLDENLDAWGTVLPPELLQQIDAIRWRHRDPAQ